MIELINEIELTDRIDIGKDIQRFWRKIDKREEDDCWIWKGAISNNRYGHMNYDGKDEYSHRLCYMISYGEIPENMEVCHNCNNPLCCNPRHLCIGTHQDNMRYMVDTGRSTKGEKHPNHLLTEEEIDQIRDKYSKSKDKIKQSDLAMMYEVSTHAISDVICNKTWKDDNYVRTVSYEHQQRLGDINGSSKLTWEKVRQIRQKHKNRIRSDYLAKEFNVSNGCISLIINNKTWKE